MFFLKDSLLFPSNSPFPSLSPLIIYIFFLFQEPPFTAIIPNLPPILYSFPSSPCDSWQTSSDISVGNYGRFSESNARQSERRSGAGKESNVRSERSAIPAQPYVSSNPSYYNPSHHQPNHKGPGLITVPLFATDRWLSTTRNMAFWDLGSRSDSYEKRDDWAISIRARFPCACADSATDAPEQAGMRKLLHSYTHVDREGERERERKGRARERKERDREIIERRKRERVLAIITNMCELASCIKR